jgi:TfdA family taurine catabolism dioxygenase TauD
MSDRSASIGGPANWLGSAISDDRWRIEIDAQHVAELRAAVAAMASIDLTAITAADVPLPTLGPVLAGVVDEIVDGRGFILLRGMPVEAMSEPELERLFWCIGIHLGIPISQNDAGDVLVHVRDEGLDFTDPHVRAYQTNEVLGYHSDSSDVVGLLCVRPAMEGGVSTIVSAAAVYNAAVAARPDLADVLESTWWWDRRKADLDVSFFQRRIFAVDGEGRFASYYGRSHIESAVRGPQVPELDGRQIEALDLLDSLANDPRFVLNMHFRPGDIQFLNNYKIWHARTSYVDYPEPERQRDLYRLWLTLRVPMHLPDDFRIGGITDREAAFG